MLCHSVDAMEMQFRRCVPQCLPQSTIFEELHEFVTFTVKLNLDWPNEQEVVVSSMLHDCFPTSGRAQPKSPFLSWSPHWVVKNFKESLTALCAHPSNYSIVVGLCEQCQGWKRCLKDEKDAWRKSALLFKPEWHLTWSVKFIWQWDRLVRPCKNGSSADLLINLAQRKVWKPPGK